MTSWPIESRFRNLLLVCAGVLSVSSSTTAETDKHIAVATWQFVNATKAVWDVLERQGGTAVEAVVAGGSDCELEPCGAGVGYGAKPDENGETTLDAMVMNGTTFDVGAVGCLREVKNAIGVAYAVLKHSTHTLLVGDLATDFAESMGFERTNLTSEKSLDERSDWTNNKCQPNFWQDVVPDPSNSCGPYTPPVSTSFVNSRLSSSQKSSYTQKSDNDVNRVVTEENHDTIRLLALDKFGGLAVGVTTNGLRHKIAGRVGDSPIVGAGGYADSSVGAAAATGNGDIMMRFLPSFVAVDLMKNGADPKSAAITALDGIRDKFPGTNSALIAINTAGEYGAACHGYQHFPFTVISRELGDVQIVNITCDEQLPSLAQHIASNSLFIYVYSFVALRFAL